jgi:hypothetical protein
MLMFADDLSQTTSDPIARHRAADFARRNEASTETINFLPGERSQHQEMAVLCTSLFAHSFELPGFSQSPAFRK